MADYLHDNVLDNGVQYLVDHGANLYLCSTQPTTYTEATSTYKLGTKTGVTMTGPANGTTNGRSATVSAITDGTVDSNGTAECFGLTDGTSLLLAAGNLASSQVVYSGNTFTLTAIELRIPDAA